MAATPSVLWRIALTMVSETPSTPSREQHLAYVLLRAFVGLDFFGHGYARIFTGTFLSGFANSMQQSMASAPLDPTLILIVAYGIPVVELAVGTLLLLGVWTGWALRGAFALMFVLIFGVTMKQDWNAASQQLLYGVVLALLLFLRERFDLPWLVLLRGKRNVPEVGAAIAHQPGRTPWETTGL